MEDTDNIYKSYELILNFLDQVLDDTIDFLNDLKLMDPDNTLSEEIVLCYKRIFDKLNEGIIKLKKEKEIVLIGDDSRIRGLELPYFLIDNPGEIRFNYPKDNQNVYKICPDISNFEIIFDGYVEVRKTVLTLKSLIKNILDYKIFLINQNN